MYRVSVHSSFELKTRDSGVGIRVGHSVFDIL